MVDAERGEFRFPLATDAVDEVGGAGRAIALQLNADIGCEMALLARGAERAIEVGYVADDRLAGGVEALASNRVKEPRSL